MSGRRRNRTYAQVDHLFRVRPSLRWLARRGQWLAPYWLRMCQGDPWTPTTSANALTFDNLERCARSREAIVADALAADLDTSNETVKLVVFAWPYLNQVQRARLLTLALTREVRAAAAAQAHERGWQ